MYVIVFNKQEHFGGQFTQKSGTSCHPALVVVKTCSCVADLELWCLPVVLKHLERLFTPCHGLEMSCGWILWSKG